MTQSTRSWTAGLGIKAVATLLLSTLLVSCGSSKKYDEFIPTRILSIGDAMSYMSFDSTTGAPQNLLTAGDPNNGNNTTHWLWTYAGAYGLSNMGRPGQAGKNVVFYNNNTDYPTSPTSDKTLDPNRTSLGTLAVIRAQANRLPSPQVGDLVVMSIGMGDIFARADALGNTSTDNKDSVARQLGLDYINLADSLYQRGFKHVLIVNSIDFSTSPYALKQSQTIPAYANNLKVLTEALNIGVNVNCNGGCTSSLESKPYPSRAEGVWRTDVYNYMYNMAIRTSTYPQFNTTQPVCYTPPAAPVQTCINKPLYDGGNPSLPYYYSGDLFTTPVMHTYVGNYMYTISRGFSGF